LKFVESQVSMTARTRSSIGGSSDSVTKGGAAVPSDADWCVIEDASAVRRWGTTKGLGELAANGPLENTKLDRAGRVRAPLRAVIAMT
jgi:hypothetical protein